jgi:hypothetical protein
LITKLGGGRLSDCSTRADHSSQYQRDFTDRLQGLAMTHGLRRPALIAREWDQWTKRRRLARHTLPAKETLRFYTELQNAKSPLLDFNSRGRDKWRIVHDWLVAAGRVIE